MQVLDLEDWQTAAQITEVIIESIAEGLHTLQETEIIKFPGVRFSAEEIESRLKFAFVDAMNKFIESKPNN
jgi:hypothetical protein